MQTANIQLALGGDKGNTIPKFLVTASEIAVLREIHGDEAVFDIEPIGDKKTSHRAERERLIAIYGAARNPEQRPIVEGLFPGAAARLFERLDELELDESFFKATRRMAPGEDTGKPAWDAGLRKDGPTISEWLDAGYSAEHYPPSGYEAKSTVEEIAAAVAARQPADATKDEGTTDEAEDDEGDINDAHTEQDQGGQGENLFA